MNNKKLWEIIEKLESTKTAFKSKVVAEAREDLISLMEDPAYNPEEIAAVTEAVGSEMTGRLTYGEAMLMCDLLNGTIMPAETVRSWPQQLSWEAADGCDLDGLDEKWKVNKTTISEKLKTLTAPQAWWLVHQVRVWWHINGVIGTASEDQTRKLFRIAE